MRETPLPAMIHAMSESKAIIFGASATALTPDEAAFFRDERPWGFILFARNIAETAQVPKATHRNCPLPWKYSARKEASRVFTLSLHMRTATDTHSLNSLNQERFRA